MSDMRVDLGGGLPVIVAPTPVVPVDPVAPVTPVIPVVPTDPVTPVLPTDPVTPVLPTDPVTPAVPVVPAAADPGHVLGSLPIVDLASIDLALAGTTLAASALSTHGESLTVPDGVTLGGLLGSDQADVIQLGAGSVLGSAVLGAGDDRLLAPAGASVTGIIDGGTGDDQITVGTGDATLRGGAGNDSLTALGSGNNRLEGGRGADTMSGGAGNDTYYVDNSADKVIEHAAGGTDTVRSSISYTLGDNVEILRLTGSGHLHGKGNALANTIYGNVSANLIDGGAGADHMIGGKGNDTYVVDTAHDRVIEKAGEGTDTVRSAVSYILGVNLEQLTLTGTATHGTGNALANVIRGNDAGDHLAGMAGNDRIVGGAGSDVITGGAGKDLVTGGAGADRFVFADGDLAGRTAATADVVKDFSHSEGDRIDLSRMDADTTHAGNQAFSFIGSHAFGHVAGQLAVEHIDGGTFLAGDTDGDGHADFLLKLDALHGAHMSAADLVL